MKAYFVTGTDTDAGKTFASCALLEAVNALGKSTLGLKPVAAGATEHAEGWRNDDALALMKHATLKRSYEEINPVLYREPASPHIAAKLEGRRATVAQILGYCRGVLTGKPDFALIEGAGGWRVPLNQHEWLSQLAVELAFPVILVVPVRLGCINHAALTVEAIRRDRLPIAGWIATTLMPEPMAHYAENLETLKRVIVAPLIAELPYIHAASPKDAIAHIKTHFLIQTV
jgi:dethiobiotin synthetase